MQTRRDKGRGYFLLSVGPLSRLVPSDAYHNAVSLDHEQKAKELAVDVWKHGITTIGGYFQILDLEVRRNFELVGL